MLVAMFFLIEAFDHREVVQLYTKVTSCGTRVSQREQHAQFILELLRLLGALCLRLKKWHHVVNAYVVFVRVGKRGSQIQNCPLFRYLLNMRGNLHIYYLFISLFYLYYIIIILFSRLFAVFWLTKRTKYIIIMYTQGIF